MRELVEYIIWVSMAAMVAVLFSIAGINYLKYHKIFFAIMCFAVIIIALIPTYIIVKELINYYHDKRSKNSNK